MLTKENMIQLLLKKDVVPALGTFLKNQEKSLELLAVKRFGDYLEYS